MIQISKLKRKQKTSKIWPKSNNSIKNKTKTRTKNIIYIIFILLNAKNCPHGCLYVVAFVLNIFENF